MPVGYPPAPQFRLLPPGGPVFLPLPLSPLPPSPSPQFPFLLSSLKLPTPSPLHCQSGSISTPLSRKMTHAELLPFPLVRPRTSCILLIHDTLSSLPSLSIDDRSLLPKMSQLRKLQGEVDKTLKDVTSHMDIFDDIHEQVRRRPARGPRRK
jgi:hypothetical protein